MEEHFDKCAYLQTFIFTNTPTHIQERINYVEDVGSKWLYKEKPLKATQTDGI